MRVLELNDVGIRLFDAQSLIAESPGIAGLEHGKLVTGATAQKLQRIDPRRSHDRFWYALEAPLESPMAEARSCADLAYAQLGSFGDALLDELLLVAAPATLKASEAALVLGLLKAAGAKTQGLFDPAVAAASSVNAAVQILHVDVQLHRFCATLLRGENELRRVRVLEHKPGWKALMDSCAAVFARAFVRQSRFDPLHSATTEQALHDQMPEWLEALGQASVHACELDIGPRLARATVERDEIHAALRPRLVELADAIGEMLGNEPTQLLLSDRAAAVPGLCKLWPDATPLEPMAMPAAALAHADRISGDPEALPWVHCLPRPTHSLDEHAATDALPATHLLCGHQAHALPVRGRIALSQWLEGAPGHLDCQQGRWQLHGAQGRVRINGRPAAKSEVLNAGDALELDDRRVILIRVLD